MIGPLGEKRRGDTLANALHVARLAAGAANEQYRDIAKQAGGRKGGRSRAKAATPVDRYQIAKRAATLR